MVDCSNFAFPTSCPKTRGHQNAVKIGQCIVNGGGLQFFGMNPTYIDLGAQRCACMNQCFGDGKVGIFEFDVFADQTNVNLMFGRSQTLHKTFPSAKFRGLALLDFEFAEDQLIQFFLRHFEGDFVDARCVQGFNDRVRGNVAEQGHFPSNFLGNWLFSAANEHIRLHACFQ